MGERDKQVDGLGQQIAEGIAQGLKDVAPKHYVKAGSSQHKYKTPFRTPRTGPKLRGTFYINGVTAHEDQHTDEEITLVNRISRSGRYINRLVEVQVSDDAGARVVLIHFNDKSPDQRMDNKNEWRNLKELLSRIVEEQGALVTA